MVAVLKAEYTPNHRALLGPQVQKHELTLLPDLVAESFESGEPRSIFLHFHPASSAQPLERFRHGTGKFHGADYKRL